MDTRDTHDPREDPDAPVPMSADADKERRRYFRIDEPIILMYREIAREDIKETPDPEGMPVNPLALSASLDLLTQESRTVLRKIERDYPEVAEFLKALEEKIDLISRALMSFEVDFAEQGTQDVNLSASGLAFFVDRAFMPGMLLELKMLLVPQPIGVVAYGRVVYCHKNQANDPAPYKVAVDFVGLSDRDRELLARHVVRRQLVQLRERKPAPD